MQTNDFLNAIQQRHGLTSDYALSKFLGITKQAISRYRNGKTSLDDEVALKVAESLDMPPGFVLASIEAERAERMKKPAAGRAWRAAAALLRSGRAAGVFAVAVLTGLQGQTALEPLGAIFRAGGKFLSLYIMSNRATAALGRIFATLARFLAPLPA